MFVEEDIPLSKFSFLLPGILAGCSQPAFEEPEKEGGAGEKGGSTTKYNEKVLDFIASHFKSIVCLRETAIPSALKLKLHALGVTPKHIPIERRKIPNDEQFDEISSWVLQRQHWPVLVFAESGRSRVSYFLAAAFISLYLRQDEPGSQLDSGHLRELLHPPLTGTSIVKFMKQQRSVDVSEEALDDLITRWKLERWQAVSRMIKPTTQSADPELVKQLEDFRQVVSGLCASSAMPSPKIPAEDLLKALDNHGGFKTIVNLEKKSYESDQKQALKSRNITLRHVVVEPGSAPTMNQCWEISEIFLNRSNWPILVNGGRGRAGCVLAIGCAALRKAQDPHLQAVGTSSNDIISFVRSHIGPFAVENIEQERILNRYVRSMKLYNFNTVIPGVLSYCAHPGTHPTTSWLAVQQRGGTSLFTSIVSFTDEPLPGAGLFESKGFLYHHIECKEGLVPAKDRLEFFIHKVLKNPSSWPILICSDNGFARSITMSVVSLLHLAHDTKLLEKFLKKNNLIPATLITSCQADDIFGWLLSIYDGDGAGLSEISDLQRRLAVREQIRLSSSSPSSSAAATAAAGGGENNNNNNNLESDLLLDGGADEHEKEILRFFGFGDFGAPRDSVKRCANFQKFTKSLSEEVAKHGRPDFVLNFGDSLYWNGAASEKGDPTFEYVFKKSLLQHENLRGIPFKCVLGNHDLRTCTVSDSEGNPTSAEIGYTLLGEEDNPCGAWQFAGERNTKPHRSYSFRHPSLPYDDRSPTRLTKEEAEASVNLPDSRKVFIAAFDANATQSRVRKELPYYTASWNRDLVWLSSELEEAQSCLFRIVFSHQPLYTQCLGHAPEALVLREGFTTKEGETLMPLEPVLIGGVDLMGVGHEHQMHLKVRGPSNIIHACSGATMSCERYGSTNPAPDLHRHDWELDEDEKAQGFLRVKVFENVKACTAKLVVEFVRSCDLKVIHRVTKLKSTSVPTNLLLGSSGTLSLASSSSGTSQGSLASLIGDARITTGDVARLSRLPKSSCRPAIIIVEYPSMLETLAPMIDRLRSFADVFAYNNTAAATEAATILLKRKIQIAALVSNMRRKHTDSGIRLLEKFTTLCQQQQLPYSVPKVMFSSKATKSPEESWKAGASIIFHTNSEKLLSCLSAIAEASRWFKLSNDIAIKASASIKSTSSSSSSSFFSATTPSFSSAATAAASSSSSSGEGKEQTNNNNNDNNETSSPTIPSASSPLLLASPTNCLRYAHCFKPLPRAFGGRLESLATQQLLWVAQCACFEKLCKNISKAVVDEAGLLGLVDKQYYQVVGESAVFFWNLLRRTSDEDTRGRTNSIDLVVHSKEAVHSLASRIASVVLASADIIRGYLAHAQIRTEPCATAEGFVQQRTVVAAPATSPTSTAAASETTTAGEGEQEEKEQQGEIWLQQKQREAEEIVEIKFQPVGQQRVSELATREQNYFTWQIARIRCRSFEEDVKLTSSSTSAASAKTATEFMSAVEAQNGTRFCPGLLVLSREGVMNELQRDPRLNMNHNKERSEMLLRYMKEIA